MLTYGDRDLIRHFLLTFLVLLAFVQVGYLVSVLLDKSPYLFGGDDNKIGWVLLYYVVSIPRQAAYIIPVATAVSILWVYTVKARQNEVLAYLSGGVSPRRLAAPLILVGAILSVLSFLTIEFAAIPGDRYGRRIERINIEGRSLDGLNREENVFQKGEGNRFYAMKEFEPNLETMELPVIMDMGEDWITPDWRLDAQSAERVRSDRPEWVFSQAVFRRYDAQGNVAEFTQYGKVGESELGVTLESELDKYLQQRARPSQISISDLAQYVRLFQSEGRRAPEYETYLYFNFAIPLGSFVLALLMCGHILRPSSAGVVVGFGGGLALISAYYFVLLGTRQLSLTGQINPLLGAITSCALFLILGVFLLSRYRPA